MSWGLLGLFSIGTFAFRSSFLVLFGEKVPPKLERALVYVPVAVLPALAASVVRGSGGLEPSRVVAALLAAGVAWKTKSIGLTMLLGMGCLWLLQWAFG